METSPSILLPLGGIVSLWQEAQEAAMERSTFDEDKCLTPEEVEKNAIIRDLAHRLKKLVHCAATLFNVMEPGATDGRIIFSVLFILWL